MLMRNQLSYNKLRKYNIKNKDVANYFGYATENSFNNSKAKEDMINGIANIISIVEKRIIISITK
jgi:hypothetical protein